MNVLYILGNGFDKAQGMKTSYPEFYQYLMENTDNASPLLQQLKKDINADKLLWSDMEEAFGQFTSKVKTSTDLEDLYFELSDYLQEYLEAEEIRQKILSLKTDSSSQKKGDLHSNALNSCLRFDYRNVLSLYGASDYSNYNFSRNSYGMSYDLFLGDNLIRGTFNNV